MQFHSCHSELVRKTVDTHERLRREWPRLAEEYRSKLSEVTSPEAWDETFRPWTQPGGERKHLDD